MFIITQTVMIIYLFQTLGEAESIEISLIEKKVTLTLTRRHPRMVKMLEKELQPFTPYKNNANKFSLVKKLFCSG